MRHRFTFSVLVGMLLMGTVADSAFAATSAKEAVVSVVTQGEASTATGASSACARSRSENGFAAESPSFFSPTPSSMSEDGCGACSDLPCKSVPLYSNCFKRVGSTSQLGQCVEPYFTAVCPTDFTWKCTCWVGPLP